MPPGQPAPTKEKPQPAGVGLVGLGGCLASDLRNRLQARGEHIAQHEAIYCNKGAPVELQKEGHHVDVDETQGKAVNEECSEGKAGKDGGGHRGS